ncbi:SMP-30/gluconolactonase/LRE family protein [Streptomyces platensis]|uniref:SMP-30/gluconolactonase/LRE family protein n=1 Tax=Streptomyces platensis TaxID=58346 RepID=UPI001F346E1F|nr:SMP-30/gluconolactonase/LRE family protein [Streptomyces platensis]
MSGQLTDRAGSGGPQTLPALRIVAPEIEGPEDVVADADGTLFAGAADGVIWRLRVSAPGAADETTAVAHTGGRPLGLEPLPGGELLVCDARRGLLCVDPRHGSVRVLADEVAGAPLRFASNVTAAADGTVYFTVSSRRYGLDEWLGDFLEHTGTGQLLRLRPGGTPEVLLDGLQFANGVALAPDESFLAVAETGARRLSRYRLTGPRAGTTDTLADELPGYPDNLSLGPDGTFWVALARPRSAGVELLHGLPRGVRRTAWEVAKRLRLSLPPHPTARVLAFRPDGGPAWDLSAVRSPYRMVTGVCRTEHLLALGSVAERGIAVCAFPGADGSFPAR